MLQSQHDVTQHEQRDATQRDSHWWQSGYLAGDGFHSLAYRPSKSSDACLNGLILI